MPLDLEQMRLSGFEPDPNLKWEKIADAPRAGARDFHALPIDDHRIFVIEASFAVNGVGGHECIVRIFDIHTGEWSAESWPNLSQPRSGFACVKCNSKVCVIGGVVDGELTNSIEYLDLSASPRQWVVMEQKLTTARRFCQAVTIDNQMYILGGYDEERHCLAIVSIEIFDTETGQLSPGPDMPPGYDHSGAIVDNALVVFSFRGEDELDAGEIHFLRHGQSSWTTKSSSFPRSLVGEDPISIGQCILPTVHSVYDTNRRARWWDLPVMPGDDWVWTVVSETEIVAFGNDGVYSLKLKLGLHSPTTTTLTSTKKVYDSMLFSPDFSDVTFVCPDGTEIPAHRCVLAAKKPLLSGLF